jgi:acetylornithine deacetylase/succinyl-diaminopimelate desuccinylase-like protein
MKTHSIKVDRDAVRSEVERCRPIFDRWLRRLVAIPTVSAIPAHRVNVRRGAEEAAHLIRELGGTAELVESAAEGGHPMVFGRFGADPRHPTVLVYDHLDVQPVLDAAAWRTPPFECTIEGDLYRGRGTTDAKGPVVTTLLAAHIARALGVPLNVVFLFDCELEIGSPNAETTIAANISMFGCDSVICPDTIWASREQPVLSAGLRGVLGFRLRLRTALHDAHAGWTGGFARNPLAELVALLAECVDGRTGEVKIPGFYNEVRALTGKELADFARCGFDPNAFRAEHGFLSARTEDPLEATRRIWALPTFEVHHVAGSLPWEDPRLMIPATAEAKVSCRLVPEMTPTRTFDRVRAFIRHRSPEVEVLQFEGIPPLRAEIEGPLADAVTASMELGFGRSPVYVREGVTIPALVALATSLEVPVTLMPLSLSDQGYHGTDERFEWFQARGGMVAYVEYFRRLAELGRRK